MRSFHLHRERTPPSSILDLLRYRHHWGLSRWCPCMDPRGHGPRHRISTDAVTQRTFTGSGSAPTAQMELLYRSGQQEVHQHYWPEERGVAARLVNSRSGRTSRPGDGTDRPYFLLSNQSVPSNQHSVVYVPLRHFTDCQDGAAYGAGPSECTAGVTPAPSENLGQDD